MEVSFTLTNPAIVLRWSDLYGSRPQVSEILSELSKFDRDILRVLFRINFQLAESSGSASIHQILESSFFSNQVLLQLTQTRKQLVVPKSIVFTRGLLLSTISLVLIACDRNGALDLEDETSRNRFGEILLKINDLIDPDRPDEESKPNWNWFDTPPSYAIQTMIRNELERSEPLSYSFARVYYLLFEAMAKSRPKIWKELDTNYFKKHKVEIYDTVLFGIMLSLHFSQIDGDIQFSMQPSVKTSELIELLNWDITKIERITQHFGSDINGYGNALMTQRISPLSMEFDQLRKKPLLVDQDELLVTDRRFLEDRCGNYLLESLYCKSEGVIDKGKLKDGLGSAFEHYVFDLLHTCLSRTNETYCRMTGDQKVADLVIESGNEMFVVELTSAILDREKKFSMSEDTISEYLRQAFKKTQKFDQLLFSCEEMAKANPSVFRLVPILVGMDPVLGSLKVEESVVQKFRERRAQEFPGQSQENVKFPRLLLLSISDFEQILMRSYHGGVTFRDQIDYLLANSDPQVSSGASLLFNRFGPTKSHVFLEKCWNAISDDVKGMFANKEESI